MKLSKLFAALSACAVSVSAMAVVSFADTVSYSTTLSLNSGDADAKMAQVTYADLGLPTNTVAITNVTFDVTWDNSTAYWAGGGGAVGIKASTDETTGWVQKDMANIPEDYTVTTWTESIDFDATDQDIASAYDGGFVQFGWWWGSDPTVDISNIVITYTVDEDDNDNNDNGEQGPDDNNDNNDNGEQVPGDDDAAVTTTTTTPAVTTVTTTVAETTTTAAATTTTAAATTAAAANVATGVQGVASIAALLAIAGAAVVVSKKH